MASGGIPKKIFSFWAGQSYPQFEASCFAAIRRLHPVEQGWNVTVLNVDQPGLEPPPTPLDGSVLTVQQLADWYRLAAIATDGGVWYDASVIMLQHSTPFWVNMHDNTLQGWSTPQSQSVPGQETLESWAFAAPAQFPFVVRWRDNFRRALTQGCVSYVNSVPIEVIAPEQTRPFHCHPCLGTYHHPFFGPATT